MQRVHFPTGQGKDIHAVDVMIVVCCLHRVLYRGGEARETARHRRHVLIACENARRIFGEVRRFHSCSSGSQGDSA